MAKPSLVFWSKIEFFQYLDIGPYHSDSLVETLGLIELHDIRAKVYSQAVTNCLLHNCSAQEAFCVFNYKHSALVIYVCKVEHKGEGIGAETTNFRWSRVKISFT